MKSLYFLFILFLFIISPLQAKNIVLIGDSLSAGYGIDPQNGWVNLLSVKLDKTGRYKLINLSTSGDTTSNGLAKLPSALADYKPEIVIIELGANDGLRGLSINQMSNNLELMIKKAIAARSKILLLATHLPPNYGPEYLRQFNMMYQNLAKRYKVSLVPMFLEGVGGNELLMQNDGLHPNEKAQPLILDNIWPVLNTLL